MNILTSIHGRRLGLGPNDELLVSGKAIYLDNQGNPTPIARVGSDKLVGIGAARVLTPIDSGRLFGFDTITGSVATLPAAVGSGAKFGFLTRVLATSNAHIVQAANANDSFIGLIAGARVDAGNAVLAFAALGGGVGVASDTVTLNRTTTGSVTLGEWLEFEDVAANTWAVSGMLSATGAAFASPFSSAV